jgi:hypothetical protein
MPDTSPIYLTTPIFYANDEPHAGHTYTLVVADALARFWRARGRRVFVVTGIDEHGDKNAQVAAKHGVTPQEWVDRMGLAAEDQGAALAFPRITADGIQTTAAELAEIALDGGTRDASQVGDLVVGEALMLEPENLHLALDVGMGMMITVVANLCQDFRAEAAAGSGPPGRLGKSTGPFGHFGSTSHHPTRFAVTT